MKDWAAPPFPPRTTLDGRAARLEPLDPGRHAADLWRALAGADLVWEYLPIGPFADEASYRAALERMGERTDIVPYVIVDRQDDLPKGHLWMMEIRPEHGVIEVGFITFSPALQRTRAATEAIYLIARRSFELGYRRLEWKCNEQNRPSKRAALRFGFTFEGLFRQHMIVKGRSRDTAWYSILDTEWPARRQAFEAWLDEANFDGSGRQRSPLMEMGARYSGSSVGGAVYSRDRA